MSDVIKAVKALFWPERCIFCGNLIFYSEKNTCKSCCDSLPFVKGKICASCGCEKEFCGCRNSITYYDRFAAPLYYENEVRKSIHNLKFNDCAEYAEHYASYMADTVKTTYADEKFDFTAAVPMYSKDQKRRGYNQSEEIAKALAGFIGVDFKKDLIKKIYPTDKQSSRNMIDRSGNVLGVFDVEENVDGKSILLVDDVRTTGSTFSECGKMLYLMGAKRVCCISFATGKYKKQRKKE